MKCKKTRHFRPGHVIFSYSTVKLPRCFFEGGSDAYIFLTTDRNVWWRGYETNSVRIDSNTETTIQIDEEGKNKLRIRFDSDTLDLGDVDYDDF